MTSYKNSENIAQKRDSFQNRMTLIVFVSLLLVGVFLLGIGAYITILEISNGIDGGIEKYMFLASGVMIILFGAQLAVLRTSKRYSEFDKMK